MARSDKDEIVSTAPEQMKVLPSRFDSETIGAINSFDDAVKLAEATYGTVTTSDGFRLANDRDKASLIGLPILFLEWDHVAGDYGDYVSANCVVKNTDGTSGKWKINDGSTTGINKQLADYTAKTGHKGGLLCNMGIRSSTYPVDPQDRKPLSKESAKTKHNGNWSHWATTYYIDITM